MLVRPAELAAGVKRPAAKIEWSTAHSKADGQGVLRGALPLSYCPIGRADWSRTNDR